MSGDKKKRVEASVPLLLRYEDKKYLLRFIQIEISSEELCSEKLTHLYKAYIKFCNEIKYNEPLKKRAFKNTLILLLKEKGMRVPDYLRSAGIIIASVGLKNWRLPSYERKVKRKVGNK
jgi:phage/plasmid-associated DNA primase